MNILLVIFVVLLFLEMAYRPRLDFCRNGQLLLWYGRKNRKFKRLI